MHTGGNDSTRGSRIKELLSGATTRDARGTTASKIGRRTRDAFFITSTAIVALVALTAISYRPSHVAAEAHSVNGDAREENAAPAQASLDAIRYPLTYAVRVVLESGNVFYFDERTAAMLGAIKLAKADGLNLASVQ